MVHDLLVFPNLLSPMEEPINSLTEGLGVYFEETEILKDFTKTSIKTFRFTEKGDFRSEKKMEPTERGHVEKTST